MTPDGKSIDQIASATNEFLMASMDSCIRRLCQMGVPMGDMDIVTFGHGNWTLRMEGVPLARWDIVTEGTTVAVRLRREVWA